MATFKIVPQTEKVNGEEIETFCKHVKCYPVEKRTGKKVDKGFGYFGFLILKVVLRCEETGAEHSITYSNAKQAPMGYDVPKQWLCHKGEIGKFIYHWPDRMEHPKIRVGAGKSMRRHYDSRRVVEDTLSPKVRVPGPTKEFETAEVLTVWLVERLGFEMAEQIITLFANKLAEIASSKAA